MTVEGIDISNNNPDQDYGPYGFVFLKATEGETYQDATYTTRHQAVRAAGKVAGAYMFYRTASSPANHVTFFERVAAIMPGDVVILDFENDGTWDQFGDQALAGMATQTMQLLMADYPHNRVLLYCNRYTFNIIIQPYNVVQGDGLWIASPNETPVMDWLFWQYAQSTVDLDRGNFSGPDALRVWATSKGQLPPGQITGQTYVEGNVGMGAWPGGTNQYHHLVFPVGPDNSGITQAGWVSLAVGGDGNSADVHLWFYGTDDPANGNGSKLLMEGDAQLGANARRYWGCPPNTDQIGVLIRSSDAELAWCLELQAK